MGNDVTAPTGWCGTNGQVRSKVGQQAEPVTYHHGTSTASTLGSPSSLSGQPFLPVQAAETRGNYQGLGGCDELGLETWLRPSDNTGVKSCEGGWDGQCGWSPCWVLWQHLLVSGSHGHTLALARGFGYGCEEPLLGTEGSGGCQDGSVQEAAGRSENCDFFPALGFSNRVEWRHLCWPLKQAREEPPGQAACVISCDSPPLSTQLEMPSQHAQIRRKQSLPNASSPAW